MSVKRQWPIRLEAVGTGLRHFYIKYTLTETRYVVYVNAVVTDGAEKGRDVALELSPDAADSLAAKLTAQAAYTRRKNEAM
jgi:hypothetical protein